MQSTQRNESMNGKIKTHITSSTRTRFIYLIKILIMIGEEESRKIESFKKKIIKLTYQQNNSLELYLATRYCTVISKKIYLEYCRSFNYLTPTTIQGTSAHFVKSSMNDKIYTIDISANKCSCLKSIYLGIPCCHIISVWRYLNKNISECIEISTNSHWNIIQAESWIPPLDLIISSHRNLQITNSNINLKHNIDNLNSESNLKFEIAAQKVIQPILDTNNYSEHSLNYDAESIIMSKETPQKIQEPIKNDQNLQTFTINYMNLNELTELKLPQSKKKSTPKSSKKRSASENSCVKIDTNTFNFQNQNELTSSFVLKSAKQSPSQSANKIIELATLSSLNTSLMKNSLKISAPNNDIIPTPVLKRVRFNMNPRLFNFITYNQQNSCCFDCITAIIYLLYQDFPNFIESGIESALLGEILSIFSLLDNDKFDIAQTDMIALIIDNDLSPTTRGEFVSVSEIIDKIFSNADDSKYLRIEDCYWCNNTNCSLVEENHNNGVRKDIVHNYVFSHVISSKAPYEGVMKSFTEYFSSTHKKFLDCDCNKVQNSLIQQIFKSETRSLIINIPDILWISMEGITKLYKDNISLFSNIIIEESFEIMIDDKSKKYLLKVIVFLESNIHWTMAYHKPSFKKTQYNEWSFYNDKCGYFQVYDNINLMISHLFKLNKIPLFLVYVLVPEFEVLKILPPRSNIINPSNGFICKHCNKNYKQIRRLDEHIKTKYCKN